MEGDTSFGKPKQRQNYSGTRLPTENALVSKVPKNVFFVHTHFFYTEIFNYKIKQNILILLAQLTVTAYASSDWYTQFLSSQIENYAAVKNSFLTKDFNPYFVIDVVALESSSTAIIYNRSVLMDHFVELYLNDSKKFEVEYLKSYNVVFQQFLDKKEKNGFDLFLHGITTRLTKAFNKILSTFVKSLVHAFWEQKFDKFYCNTLFKIILNKVPIDFTILNSTFVEHLRYGLEKKFHSLYYNDRSILYQKLADFFLEGPNFNLSKNTHYFLKLFVTTSGVCVTSWGRQIFTLEQIEQIERARETVKAWTIIEEQPRVAKAWTAIEEQPRVAKAWTAIEEQPRVASVSKKKFSLKALKLNKNRKFFLLFFKGFRIFPKLWRNSVFYTGRYFNRSIFSFLKAISFKFKAIKSSFFSLKLRNFFKSSFFFFKNFQLSSLIFLFFFWFLHYLDRFLHFFNIYIFVWWFKSIFFFLVYSTNFFFNVFFFSDFFEHTFLCYSGYKGKNFFLKLLHYNFFFFMFLKKALRFEFFYEKNSKLLLRFNFFNGFFKKFSQKKKLQLCRFPFF
jgi:hypothetical protein